MRPFVEEYRYLRQVLSVIMSELASLRESLAQKNIELREVRKEEFKEGLRGLSFEDHIEISQGLSRIAEVETRRSSLLERTRRLDKMKDSPYFARIDFRPKARDQEIQVYLGISSLVEPETGKHLIFDWRAPISSLYYDFALGPASYKAVSSVIEGEITLKRQYKIDQGVLERVFDTDLAITDELLQEVLGTASGDKMRAIINTIQREQNKVIRDDTHKVLIVQGAAGSGKTSVALHRVAYLLYKHRGNLKAEDVVIFSPNRVFSDYISQVLPDLGEDQVEMTTFKDLAEELSGISHVQSFSAHTDAVLHGHESRGSNLKRGQTYLDLIFKHVKEQGETCPFKDDITINKRIVIQAKEIQELFYKDYSYLPPFARVGKIVNRILWLLEPLEKQRSKDLEAKMTEDPRHRLDLMSDIRDTAWRRAKDEFNAVRRRVEDTGILSALSVYKDVLRNLPEEVFQDTSKALDLGFLPYEDVAPYLLLKFSLEGAPAKENVKHVVVDEAQDYSLVQYHLLKLLYPNARFTILGDLNQTINQDQSLENYEDLKELFGDENTSLITLKKSYRSTVQILRFSNELLDTVPSEPAVEREGPLPVVHLSSSFPASLDLISEALKGLEGATGIIAKTAQDALALYEGLKERGHSPTLLTRDDQRFKRGVIVLPIYLAKGLEFENVLLTSVNEREYNSPGHRLLLYTGCTRALKSLHLFSDDKLSPFIETVNPSFYSLKKD